MAMPIVPHAKAFNPQPRYELKRRNMVIVCEWCKQVKDKLYDFAGFKVCWNCYWKRVDAIKLKKTNLLACTHR